MGWFGRGFPTPRATEPLFVLLMGARRWDSGPPLKIQQPIRFRVLKGVYVFRCRYICPQESLSFLWAAETELEKHIDLPLSPRASYGLLLAQARLYHCFNSKPRSHECAHQPVSLTLPCLCDREQDGDGAPVQLFSISGTAQRPTGTPKQGPKWTDPPPQPGVSWSRPKMVSPHLNSSSVNPGSSTQWPVTLLRVVNFSYPEEVDQASTVLQIGFVLLQVFLFLLNLMMIF